MNKQEQDRDLLWIFSLAGSPNSSDDEVEQTSSSGDPHEPPKPTEHAHEETSCSSSGDPHEPPTKKPLLQEPTEPIEECTSSSSEMLALTELAEASSEEMGTSAFPKPPARSYTTRRRIMKGRQGTIPVESILLRATFRICRKAAEFCIGVGPGRTTRVLNGSPDCRFKGSRVPNNHPCLTSTPMATCLRFLWRKYHFDTEGLPDKFSFERHDASSLTIASMGCQTISAVGQT